MSSSVKWKKEHPEQAKINQNRYNDKHRGKKFCKDINLDYIIDKLLSSKLSVLDIEKYYGEINNLIIKSHVNR